MNLKWFLALIKTLGPKLPIAWPLILHIVSDLREIAAIIAAPAPGSFAAGPVPKAEIEAAKSQLKELDKALKAA